MQQYWVIRICLLLNCTALVFGQNYFIRTDDVDYENWDYLAYPPDFDYVRDRSFSKAIMSQPGLGPAMSGFLVQQNDVSIMPMQETGEELLYDYYEFGGPPSPPDYGGEWGWFGPPPPNNQGPRPPPPTKAKPSISSKPKPTKPKPSKPKPKPIVPSVITQGGGGGSDGWSGPEDPKVDEPKIEGTKVNESNEKGKDKFADLKEKWNKFVDKFKLKDKDKKPEVSEPETEGWGLGVPPKVGPIAGSGPEQLNNWDPSPPTQGGGWIKPPPSGPFLEIFLGPPFDKK